MNAAVSLTYLLKDEEVEIRAGSYDRGSARYEQFVSYVKEHATSEKPSEENEGATVYTLNEKDVIAWGETDNRNLFETTNKELISYLKSEGYSVKRTETKKNNTVEIMPYGVITTSFEYGEFYLIDETSRIFINSDLLSGKIARLNIYPAVGDDASNLSESQKMRHTSEVTAKIAIKIAPKCSSSASEFEKDLYSLYTEDRYKNFFDDDYGIGYEWPTIFMLANSSENFDNQCMFGILACGESGTLYGEPYAWPR